MLDVLILAGGQATRLHGLWGGPKCLVPVNGQPLLALLLAGVRSLPLGRVLLLLGHRSAEVIHWMESAPNGEPPQFCPPLCYVIDRGPIYYEQLGTDESISRALSGVVPGHAALVLNGDTLPQYSLWGFVEIAARPRNSGAVAAWHRGSYAGTMYLTSNAVEQVQLRGFASVLTDAAHLDVPGFLDVGTPEGFAEAQRWK